MSKKRLREQATAQSRNVEVFEDLAHESVDIRLKATKKLLASLSVERNPSKADVNVTVQRLIRGLCSARKAARFGYAVALTELLVQLWGPDATQGEKLELSISDILTLVEEQTEIGASAPAAEVKDHSFGRVFAQEAVIKSAILFQGRATKEQWGRVLDAIFALARQKSWLRELCGWTLYQALDVIEKQPKAKRHVKALIQRLPEDSFSDTAEGVAIWLKVRHLAVDVKLPKGVWLKRNPLHPNELTRLAIILREASPHDEPKKDEPKENELKKVESKKDRKRFKSQGTWSSNLHFVWDEIVAYLLRQAQQSDQEERMEARFEDFWAVAVDDSLFGMSSSAERKYSGYLLFQRYVIILSNDSLLAIFKKNFLRCLAIHSSSDHMLNAMAQKSLSAMTSKAEMAPSAVPTLIEGLLRAIDQKSFDALFRSKQVQKLITSAESSSLRTVLGKLDRLLLDPQTEEEGLAVARRQSIGDTMVAVFRSRCTQKKCRLDKDSPEFRILVMLFLHAGFSPSSTFDGSEVTPNPPLTKSSRRLIGARLDACLTIILTQGKDSVECVSHLLGAVDGLENSSEAGPIQRHCSEVASIEIRKVQTEWDLSKGRNTMVLGDGLVRSLDLLIAMTSIQAYNDDEDAINLLRDLAECIKDMGDNRMNTVAERIVEILLTLIAKPSVLGKRLAAQVFPEISSLITQAGLDALLKVLDTEENLHGQTELFEDADEVLENAVFADGGSDVDMMDAEEASSHSEDSAGDSGEDVEDVEAGDDEELATFNAKLAEALGTRPGKEDIDAVESAGSDDEDMDDEQMEGLDATLEKVFRERAKVAKKRNQGKEARENVVLFKKGVLDLLGIYIKHQHSSDLGVNIVLPLLRSVRTMRNQGVVGQSIQLLRDFNKLYKLQDHGRENRGAVDNRDHLWAVLRDIHQEAMNGGDARAYQSACSIASILVAKILLATAGSETETAVKGIMDVYAQSQCAFLQDAKLKLRPAFFSDWINWMASNREAVAHAVAPKVNGDHAN